jgi:hypothetical protein
MKRKDTRAEKATRLFNERIAEMKAAEIANGHNPNAYGITVIPSNTKVEYKSTQIDFSDVNQVKKFIYGK